MLTEAVGRELVETYWNALYSGDHSKLPGILAEDIKVTVLFPVKKEFTSRAQLIGIAESIRTVLSEKIASNIKVVCDETSIHVDFNHELRLKSGKITHTAGFQDWTVKFPDGKPVLASLVVSEKPVVAKSAESEITTTGELAAAGKSAEQKT